MKPRKPQSEIYGASIRHFAENGYDKTTLDMIADSLSMGKTNLYHYADGKKDLYEKSIRYGLNEWHHAVAASIVEISRPDEKFRTMCFEAYNYLKINSAFRLMLRLDQSIFPTSTDDDRFSDINYTAMKMMEQIITEGVNKGTFRKVDPEKTARYLYSVYIMFIVKTYVKDDSSTDDDLFKTAVELNLNGLLMR